ncbi:MAG: CorA family divalent cation transporter [Pseudolabrys sp.]
MPSSARCLKSVRSNPFATRPPTTKRTGSSGAENTRGPRLAQSSVVATLWLRCDPSSEEIIGVVPDLHQEFAQLGENLVRLRFVMTDRMLITARQRPAHSIESNRRAIESGKRFPTANSFLDSVIDQFADAIARMAETLGDELDRAEDHVLHQEPDDERQRIGRVRLQAVRVPRQLAQLRGMFHRLEPRLAAHDTQAAGAIRGLAQKLDAIDHEVGSLHERARLLLDELDAKMTTVTNRRLFTLSILTACLLPPTLVTGFFGMNTKDMPFQDTDGGTWMAALVALAAGLTCYWALRRLRAF